MRGITVAIVLSFFLLSGCSAIDWVAGGFEGMACPFFGDETEDHCYQDAAVRQGDADDCSKIKAAGFTEAQGPAPRDKCYLRIAEKTGDPEPCDKIVGGSISYTKQECLYRAALKSGDISICEKIVGSASSTFRGTFNTETCLKSIVPKDQPEKEEEDVEEEAEEEKGECKYDDDCKGFCEGNVMWKQGCNARTNKCEKTFDYNCAEQSDTLQGHSESKICLGDKCVFNKNAFLDYRKQLSDEAKALLQEKQELTALMLQVNKNCLNGIADVTNKLIIDTAQLAATALAPVSVAKGGIVAVQRLKEVIGEGAVQLIEEIKASPPMGTKPEDYIALNCNLYKEIGEELPRMDVEIKERTDKARELEADIILKSYEQK